MLMNRSINLSRHGATLAVLLILAGCVSAQSPPLAELTLARTAIAEAELAGAGQVAPAQLNAARERLAEAEQLAVNDEDLARWRAKEAQSAAQDAEAAARDSRAPITVAGGPGPDRLPTP
jgi:hypothetical protein